MTLIRRGVADVAARRRDHEPAREVERGRDLFAAREQRDRSRPELVSVGDGELADATVGTSDVDGRARGIGDGRPGPETRRLSELFRALTEQEGERVESRNPAT